MPTATYIGLLRAVNLPGHNKITMNELRDFLAAIGMSDPKTLLASGNFVFGCETRPPIELERQLAAAARKRLGLETDFFVRTTNEWKGVIADNPFPKEAKSDPSHLLVMFLNDAPDAAAVKALQQAIVGREVVRAKGRQAYIVFPDGIGRSKLPGALIDKTFGRGTARNWNTVLKLAALAGA